LQIINIGSEDKKRIKRLGKKGKVENKESKTEEKKSGGNE